MLQSISSYSFMAIAEFLTSPEDDDRRGSGFVWPAKAVLENLMPESAGQSAQPKANVNEPTANGHANGSVSKRKKRS